MYFFLLHHVLKIFPGLSELSNLRKNVITFMVGVILYIMTYAYLQTVVLNGGGIFVETIRNFFVYILVADTISMGIIYREFYGRSIASELFDKPGKWFWNDSDEKYEETDLSMKEKFFSNKMDKLDLIDDIEEKATEIIRDLNENKEKLDKIDQIEENLA
jgi:hypothetical protein